MLQNTHTVLVGLLAVIGAILFKVPDTLEAGVLFFLIVALVGVLLLHDARITMLRVSCAAILLMIFAGLIWGLASDPQRLRALRAQILGSRSSSVMEREVDAVLAEAGLAEVTGLLRDKGVVNLETLRAMAGEDVDLETLLALNFPYATAKVFVAKRGKILADLEYRARVHKEQGNQRLFDAARAYQHTATSFQKMRDLIQQGSHPDGYKNKDGWTALIWASCNGHAEVVRFLLDNGANPDVQGGDGWTALLWASHNGYKEVAAMLLESDASTDIQGQSGGTALTRACDRGHEKIVQMLLDRGASTDVQNALGYTALMWASARGHLEVVRMLVEKEARTDLRNIDGDTALIEASRKGHAQVVQLLLDTGGITAKEAGEALPFVTLAAHSTVVRMLEAHVRKSASVEQDMLKLVEDQLKEVRHSLEQDQS